MKLLTNGSEEITMDIKSWSFWLGVYSHLYHTK